MVYTNVPALLTTIVVIGMLSVGLIFLQAAINRVVTAGSLIIGILNGIFMIILGRFYRTIARKLTEYENHRTESEFEDALIVKILVYEMFNAYTLLFYYAYGLMYIPEYVFIFSSRSPIVATISP